LGGTRTELGEEYYAPSGEKNVLAPGPRTRKKELAALLRWCRRM